MSRLRLPAWARLSLAIVTLLAAAAAPSRMEQPARARGTCDHVLVVSVDGLRSDALLAAPALPAFRRLMEGAATLNARTDPDFTTTMPNHVGMVTGRCSGGTGGHGWILNDDVPRAHVLHRDGPYIAGMFDVAHDHGVFTAVIAGKSKFALFDASWDDAHGAPDASGPDHGRDKLDAYEHVEWVPGSPRQQSARATDRALSLLGSDRGRSLILLHYAAPDILAHEHGWDLTAGSAYLGAVEEVDRQLGRLLDFVQTHPSTRDRCAIVLTTDHGGGGPHHHHARTDLWVNYIIPFMAWRGGVAGGDLYRLNPATRRDPGLWQPPAGADPPPIRNSDAANLALGLLGLPPVPGSTVNRRAELAIEPAAPPGRTD
jgi:predicted AlkP superfamily pyrophosphatase or phosphodiesterase